ELGAEDPDSIVRAATGRLILGHRAGNLPSAIRAGSSVMEVVDDVTDPLIRSSFWNGLCAALSLAGRYDEVIRATSAAAQEMDRSHTAFSRYHTMSLRVLAHAGLKRYAQAKSALAEIVDYATAVGDLYLVAMSELHQMRLSLYEGQPEACLEALTDVQLDVGLPALEAEFLATRAAALTCLGETSQALRLCDRAEKLSGWIEPRLLVSWARVLALANSNPSCASAAVKSIFEITSREGAEDVCVFAWRVNPFILTLLQEQPETHSNLVRILRNSGDAHLVHQLQGRAEKAHPDLTV